MMKLSTVCDEFIELPMKQQGIADAKVFSTRPL